MLAHQLPILPPLKIFCRELPSFFGWLNNRKVYINHFPKGHRKMDRYAIVLQICPNLRGKDGWIPDQVRKDGVVREGRGCVGIMSF